MAGLEGKLTKFETLECQISLGEFMLCIMLDKFEIRNFGMFTIKPAIARTRKYSLIRHHSHGYKDKDKDKEGYKEIRMEIRKFLAKDKIQ